MATSTFANRLLIKTTYKALLKTAARLDAIVPRPSVVTELVRMGFGGKGETFGAAVRSSFRAVPQAGIDAALVALREVSITISAS
jgi:hypothetical protein